MASLTVDLTDIDAIIFDLGGVIINIGYSKTVEALKKLTSEYEDFDSQIDQIDLFLQYEMGQISSDDFRQGLRRLLVSPNISAESLDSAWNAMLLDIPSNRIEQLGLLAKIKRVFVLSNTNEIHKTAFDGIFAESSGNATGSIESLVEKVYCSHLMGDRKPNASIFETIIAEQELVPERTLFIDDTLVHIKSAQTVGLQTLHLDNKGKGLIFEDIQWN